MHQVTEIPEPDRKTDRPGLYKTAQGYLINKDNEALAAYKKRKKREQTVEQFQDQLNGLKSDMTEIKELLKGLYR